MVIWDFGVIFFVIVKVAGGVLFTSITSRR